MKTVSAVIDALDGPSAVARKLGVEPQVVCNWASRKSIPWEYHDDLIRLADEKSVDLTRRDLTALVKRRRAA